MHKIAVKYATFAVLATLANLIVQEIVLRLFARAAQGSTSFTPTDSLYHSNLYIGIIAGTVAGLCCKYALDKRYIFKFVTHSSQENLQKFMAYTLTGIVTTLIFWSFELGFEYLFQSKLARYLGASLGLALGYGIKYQLDKRYVFVSPQTQELKL